MADAGRGTAATLFEALAESAPDVIVTIDASGTILFVNRAVETVLGFQPSELVGQPLSVIMPERLREAHDSAFTRYLATSTRTLSWTGVPLTALAVDGREIPVEISFGEFRTDEGRRVFSGFIRDASERHEHLRRLHESFETQTLQAELLGAVEQAVISTDLEGTVLSWNEFATALYGWTAAEAVGNNLNALLKPDEGREHRSPTVPAIQRLRSGERVRYERLVRRRDGQHIWVAVVAAPVRDAQGRLTRLIGTSIDVTERRALEDQLRQAQKLDAVGRLAAGVAHDFNNLLTVINGHAELLVMDLGVGSDAAAEAREIIRAADRGAALARQLLSFSRPKAGTPTTICLNDVVRDVRTMLARLVESHIVLEYDLADDVPLVVTDRAQLEQVVVNLVVNARDAMPEGGRILVCTRRLDQREGTPGRPAGKYASLVVEDEGIGMNAETLARIFEPFFTTKPPSRGTGLGLATVYAIVKQWGGFVEVDSAPGEGTSFIISLPSDAPAAGAHDL